MIRIYLLAMLMIFAAGCGIDLDPCTYEVGDTFKIKIRQSGYVDKVLMDSSGCDIPATLTFVNKYIIWRERGDVIKVVITRRVGEHAYYVRVTK